MRCLIIRTSALGDIVHCLPVLVALRRRLPRARIGWVVERPFAPLLADHPDLDEVIPADLRLWRHRPFSPRTLREIGQFIGSLHRFAPEVALDLMGNHKAGAIAALSMAERRIGLKRALRREPSSAVWINEGVNARGEHAVDRALSVLEPLGAAGGDVDFGPDRLSTEVPAAALQFLRGSSGFVLIHPGAGWGNKAYPPRLWAEVARRLQGRTGLDIWVASGPGEEELAREVVAASNGACKHLTAVGLPLLVALTRHARLVLAGDTGPLHLAHALGTPVLCLMGPTDPARNGPYRSPDAAIFKRLPCSFCHQRFSQAKACLLAIEPETVAQRAASLLQGRDGRPPSAARSSGAD